MVRCCLRRVPSAANCFAAAAHWGHILVIRSLIHLRFSFVSVSIKLFSSSNLISAGFKRRQCIISNCCYCKQHCWANNVGSCRVGVDSGVQTDATTRNNVGTCSALWEGYNHKTLRTMFNARTWSQNVKRAVQTDPTLLRYASVITEQKKCWESLAQKFYRFQTLHNNSPLHATGSADRAADGQCWDIYLYHNIVVIQIENFPLFFSFARFRVIQLFGMPMSK